MHCYLAIDLGAESGRVIAGIIKDNQVELHEIHRFTNRVSKFDDGSMHWHLEELLENSIEGIRKAIEEGFKPVSMSVDSWGVDYVFLDDNGDWMLPGHHYRDARTERGVSRTLDHISLNELYSETGIQFMPLNTLFQVMADPPEKLAKAKTILGVGDALNYQLGGEAVYEVSMASTSQFYNPAKRDWSDAVIEKLGLPRSLFPKIVPSGTQIGHLKNEICRRIDLEGEPPAIIATCSHDTGAAVAAIPSQKQHWAYLSSGTWSLMGLELEDPILSNECREYNFTNEVGYGHSIRLLKNISGMWLIQECRREWLNNGEELSYAELSDLASKEVGFRSLINPSSQDFIAPKSMPQAIQEFCKRTDQTIPETKGQLIRCALDSLALLYRKTLVELEALTGNKCEVLHIVGGGSQNELLNQLAADVCEIEVVAGPIEATALGNILIQHMTHQNLTLENIRSILAETFQVKNFHPAPDGFPSRIWADFQKLC